ncbi:MAG: YHYH protein, partial [Saprospiraceae bacterium]
NDKVFLENEDHSIVSFPIKELSAADRQFVQQRAETIQKLNSSSVEPIPDEQLRQTFLKKTAAVLVFLLIISGFFYHFAGKKRRKFAFYFLGIGLLSTIYSFKNKPFLLGTDPKVMDLAFAPFKPNVYTTWNNTYFLVHSKGIPTTHKMMTGITGWQQQVPIPQCYIGNNAWSIPLNPEIAATPVPVNSQHFTKGAVAVAVNGIAIFNPFTNTGVDALVDGQLDNWGGHCGRADDYHYHIAPLHLYDHTLKTLPIAYALDGFAIYGSQEPDGSSMKALDANHGHYGVDGVYHYHGTAAFPYMIGNMVGKITEDADKQIIPQASAKPIRPAGTPLKGAAITACEPNIVGNGYSLSYTLSGKTYVWDYKWDNAGNYVFNFDGPSGKSTSTYKGSAPCTVPVAVGDQQSDQLNVQIFPNPAQNELFISLDEKATAARIRKVSLFNAAGKTVFESNSYQENIKTDGFPRGIYLFQMLTNDKVYVKKLILD